MTPDSTIAITLSQLGALLMALLAGAYWLFRQVFLPVQAELATKAGAAEMKALSDEVKKMVAKEAHDKLEARFNEFREQIRTEMGDIKSDLKVVSTKIEGIDEKLTSLDGKLGNLDGKLDSLVNRFNDRKPL